jgi:hypothetical protein
LWIAFLKHLAKTPPAKRRRGNDQAKRSRCPNSVVFVILIVIVVIVTIIIVVIVIMIIVVFVIVIVIVVFVIVVFVIVVFIIVVGIAARVTGTVVVILFDLEAQQVPGGVVIEIALPAAAIGVDVKGPIPLDVDLDPDEPLSSKVLDDAVDSLLRLGTGGGASNGDGNDGRGQKS